MRSGAGTPASHPGGTNPPGFSGEHDEVFGHTDDVGEPALFQAIAEFARDSVPGIGDHHLAGQSLGSYPVEQLQGDPGFGQ